MKTMPVTRKKILALVVVLIIIGALVQRDFVRAGQIVIAVALSLYFVYGLPGAYKCILRLKSCGSVQLYRLAAMLIVACMITSIIISGYIYYFLMLILLALDYVMEEKQMSK